MLNGSKRSKSVVAQVPATPKSSQTNSPKMMASSTVPVALTVTSANLIPSVVETPATDQDLISRKEISPKSKETATELPVEPAKAKSKSKRSKRKSPAVEQPKSADVMQAAQTTKPKTKSVEQPKSADKTKSVEPTVNKTNPTEKTVTKPIVANKENVTSTDAIPAATKPTPTETPKKIGSSVPILNLPVVQPIEKGTTLKMMRRPRGVPRSAQRAINTSSNVQNVLQQMVGGSQRTGVPCGRCDCCQSLLTYVTVLRNFMDHIVSGMAQGTEITDETPMPPPPPCTLCEVQHVQHVDHTPNTSQGGTQQSTTIHTSPTHHSQSGTGSVAHQQVGNVQASNQQGSKVQAPYQQSPQHTQGNYGTGSSTQHHVQGHNQQPSHYNQLNWQQFGQSGAPQGQGGSSHAQYPQPSSASGNAPSNQVHNQSPVGVSSTQQQGNSGSSNSWATFTDPNAPTQYQQGQSHHQNNAQNPSGQSHHQNQVQNPLGQTPTSGDGGPKPRRVENVAWGGIAQRPSTQDNMSSEIPLTESPTEPFPTGSPTKQHLEQYDQSYFEEEYEDDEDYEVETNHAYVTLATDNQTALLCMVLGNSLLLSGTTKSLVIFVTEDVSPHMRYLLSTIYNNVENIDMMQSPGTTTLSLLEQPDLGVSFTKLLIWGIEKFDKGVFLDPNTLVVQNCDDLFEREELSAVPDIGWPDCFNGDVFVYKPSMETFWSLLKCAEDQDNFDGGDQGLLNMYFRDWSRNISKKLPFLYNLMANVSYTYKPAFKQFGSQVKIVNFFGSYKPLNVQFHSATGQMSPDSNVHPTYAQFVYYWLELFTKRVLPLFSQEIHDFVDKQEYSSAMDVLKFFPSNARKRKESLPMPPSFRVYADSNLDRPRRRSVIALNREDSDEESGLATHDDSPSEEVGTEDPVVEISTEPLTMPGSEIGNYQDMSAWEHGRMDYLGTHSSDTIMARLSYLMKNPPTPES